MTKRTEIVSVDRELDWKKNKLLNPTSKKPARTAVLIICPPQFDNSYHHNRWQLGQKVWQQYMNSHPHVDCYFVQSTLPKDGTAEQVWRENNTLFVGDPSFAIDGRDRILYKTIAAIELLLPQYTHFFRTNLNTFINLKTLHNYAEMHHQSMYTGPLWQNEWYVVGYGILFTADVAAHMVKEYKRLEGSEAVSCSRADDRALASLATGINRFKPSERVFTCCPTLKLGVRQLMCDRSFATQRLSQYGTILLPPISLKGAIRYCELSPKTTILYRIREGFELEQLAQLYEYLLHRIYPEVSSANLVGYVGTLPTMKNF